MCMHFQPVVTLVANCKSDSEYLLVAGFVVCLSGIYSTTFCGQKLFGPESLRHMVSTDEYYGKSFGFDHQMRNVESQSKAFLQHEANTFRFCCFFSCFVEFLFHSFRWAVTFIIALVKRKWRYDSLPKWYYWYPCPLFNSKPTTPSMKKNKWNNDWYSKTTPHFSASLQFLPLFVPCQVL